MRDQSTVLYHTNTAYTCISGVMYNELTARVTVVTQQAIGIIVIGKLLYNTLFVLTRFFVKRGGVGFGLMMCKFMFYIYM